MCDSVFAHEFRDLGIKKDATRHTDPKVFLLWWTQKIGLDYLFEFAW